MLEITCAPGLLKMQVALLASDSGSELRLSPELSLDSTGGIMDLSGSSVAAAGDYLCSVATKGTVVSSCL